MQIKSSSIYKVLAILLLSVYMYSLFHLAYMGLMSVLDNCPYQTANHELCLTALKLQEGAVTEAQKILYLLAAVFLLPFTLYIFKKVASSTKIDKNPENSPPPFLQNLFATGILHTKVYQCFVV